MNSNTLDLTPQESQLLSRFILAALKGTGRRVFLTDAEKPVAEALCRRIVESAMVPGIER